MKWIKGIFGLRDDREPNPPLPTPPLDARPRQGHWTEIVKRHDARARHSTPAAPISAKHLSMQAQVDDKPTYELAASGKHDIDVMRSCCEAEIDNYWRQPEGERLCAAPYYFMRLAILNRKAKNYAAEIAACESWKAIINDYKRQPMVRARRAALAHKGSDSVALLARIPKAKELLRKQKAAAKASQKN